MNQRMTIWDTTADAAEFVADNAAPAIIVLRDNHTKRLIQRSLSGLDLGRISALDLVDVAQQFEKS